MSTQNKKQSNDQKKLELLGITCEIDKLLYFPLRYENETVITPISQYPHGSEKKVLIEGVTREIKEILVHGRRQLLVLIEDETAILYLRFIHYSSWMKRLFEKGTRGRAFGEILVGYNGLEMIHPRYRVIGDSDALPKTLTPIYPMPNGVKQNDINKIIAPAVQNIQLKDTLSATLLARLQLPTFEQAVQYLHNPPADAPMEQLMNKTHPAWQRMKFDELLAQQLSMHRAQIQRRTFKAPVLKTRNGKRKAFINQLPFTLTKAQQKVIRTIDADLAKAYPMHRLLQGDVGSGKTVVAAISALRAIDNGFQVAIMAPTEILAEQHYQRLSTWFDAVGVKVIYLSGSQKKKEKALALEAIRNNEAQLVIGTHALIQNDVVFHRLGLVIVDEQHRFGVEQRMTLRSKGEADFIRPHQLMMSATPIPRTLAMTYYADLDVSVIDELPPGRMPIVTALVSQEKRDYLIERLRQAILSGRQAYWVCPLIEESERFKFETVFQVQEQLQKAMPSVRIGLLHGKMSAQEKQEIMDAFLKQEVKVLVATTVIEVGVDVPNASIMVIDHAEHFGLAQLHQLRGRVGRGSRSSSCVLLYQGPLTETAQQRLNIMRETQDGFVIAQRDLDIRGPGEVLGEKQSGEMLLRFANLATDQHLIDQAMQIANELLMSGLAQSQQMIKEHLARWAYLTKEEYLSS